MNETLWDILTDPAHIGAEFISHVIYDVLLGLLALPLFRRYVKREHNKIDAEHGIDDHGRINNTDPNFNALFYDE